MLMFMLCKYSRTLQLALNFSLLAGPEEEQTSDMGARDQPPTPQKGKEGEGDEKESELKKQEMLVQYLKDTESFALQVERAIAIINNMLYWKTTTGNIFIFIGKLVQVISYVYICNKIFSFNGVLVCILYICVSNYTKEHFFEYIISV